MGGTWRKGWMGCSWTCLPLCQLFMSSMLMESHGLVCKPLLKTGLHRIFEKMSLLSKNPKGRTHIMSLKHWISCKYNVLCLGRPVSCCPSVMLSISYASVPFSSLITWHSQIPPLFSSLDEVVAALSTPPRLSVFLVSYESEPMFIQCVFKSVMRVSITFCEETKAISD